MTIMFFAKLPLIGYGALISIIFIFTACSAFCPQYSEHKVTKADTCRLKLVTPRSNKSPIDKEKDRQGKQRLSPDDDKQGTLLMEKQSNKKTVIRQKRALNILWRFYPVVVPDVISDYNITKKKPVAQTKAHLDENGLLLMASRLQAEIINRLF